MNSSDLPQEILDGAYRIFIQETAQAVSDAQFILSPEELAGHPLLNDAKIKIHRIRGGAGFFGLDSVERAAHELETILKDLIEHHNGESSSVRDAYTKLVVEINTSVKP